MLEKGISSAIAAIIIVLIVTALAGTGYLYTSGVLIASAQGIEVVNVVCGEGEVIILLRNIGTVNITSLNVEQISPTGDTADDWSGTFEPGEILSYTDICVGDQPRMCIYRITPSKGGSKTVSWQCLRTAAEVCDSDGTCDSGESYSNCPGDCCQADCTDFGDSICHSACNGLNGCTMTAVCDAKVLPASVCCDGDEGKIDCCEGSCVDCGAETACAYTSCLDDNTLDGTFTDFWCVDSGDADHCTSGSVSCSDDCPSPQCCLSAACVDEGTCSDANICSGSAWIAHCGDGVCNCGENATSCPADPCISCGDGTCDPGEDYLNCPGDCCQADCTDFGDSICHSACDTYNGCTMTAVCDAKASTAYICCNANEGRIDCCEGSCADCGTETYTYTSCLDDNTREGNYTDYWCVDSGDADYCTSGMSPYSADCTLPQCCLNGNCVNEGSCNIAGGTICSGSAWIAHCGDGVCNCGENAASCPADPCGSLTFYDDFETGFGNWANVAGDDFDWTRRIGSTPSSGTGPSSAHGGSYYVYTESSSPNYPNKTAILEGPTFTFSSGSTNFWYHMYGGIVGTLYLEIASSPYTTWDTVWSLSGNQGDIWLFTNVDLSPYAGDLKRIRFRGVTSTSYTSDMALDDITITYQP